MTTFQPLIAAAASPSSQTIPYPARYPVAIIGAGALGLSFAARIARTLRVAVVARDRAAAARLRQGVRVGDTLFQPEAWAPEEAPQADWVIVLVKTGDTAAAARSAARMQPLGVLSLQNGLVEPVLQAHCPLPRVAQGITTTGAFRDASGVTPSGDGEVLVPPGFEELASMLARAGLDARVEDDIVPARLAKLLVNLAINPLAALFRVRNGELLEAPYRFWLDALVAEAWPVLCAEGLALDEAAAHARVRAVAQATATNRASMLQDVLAGRPTELDAITGVLIELAARQGAAVPTHRAVHRLLSLVEAPAG